MPNLSIPLLNVPRQSLLVTLAEQDVRLTVWWQPADRHWYGSMEYPAGTPLVSGRRIVLDSPLIGAQARRFVGDLYCRAIAQSAEPGREPWGNTHRLIYESE